MRPRLNQCFRNLDNKKRIQRECEETVKRGSVKVEDINFVE